jgi:hypothetical protein
VASQKDILKRLAKRLTGAEIGRLLIQESWEVEHRRDATWTDTEILSLKRHLRTPQDIKDYMRLVEIYQLVSALLQEAHILALELQLSLVHSIGLLQRYVVDARARLYRISTPAIVSRLQYEAIKTKQRAAKLQEVHSLGEVIDWRTYALASEDIQEQCLHDPALVAADHPDLYRQGITQIMEFVTAGRFQLIMQPQDRERVEALLAKPASGITAEENGWAEIFERAHLSAEQLYAAGLPEWITHVDRVETGYCADEPAGYGYAVLQDPAPELVDSNGHYKPSPRGLNELTGLHTVEAYWKTKSMGLGEVLQHAHEAIRQRLKRFLMLHTAIEIVSETISVRLTEDMERWYQEIESYVHAYNALIHEDLPHASRLPPLSPLMVEALKPPPAAITFVRERLVRDLTEQAWIAAFQALEEGESDGAGEASHEVEGE